MKKFTFKFDRGDTAWSIRSFQKSKNVKCKACNGTGNIPLMNDDEISCPRCGYGYNNGYVTEYEPMQSNVAGLVTIGQQRVEIDSEIREQYMCVETGIGSGSIHNVETLFATEKEAQLECDRLNKETE